MFELRALAFVLALVAAAAAQTHDPLRGLVVNPDGQPVAGALVEAWRELGEGTSILDLTYSHTEKLVAKVPTDKRGGFAMQLPVGIPCQLRIDHPPYGRWIRVDVLPGEELRIELAAPAAFVGRIVMAGSVGTPATLRAFQPDGIRLPLGRTDDDGNFRFERLPAGKFTVEIAPDKASSPGWQDVEFVAGETVERNFEVPAGVLLQGRVTDAATGAPIQGATVGEGWTLFKGVRTDADGRYRLEGFGARGRTEVRCEAVGFSAAQVERPAELANPTEMNFALERGNSAVGRVVDVEGNPLEGIYVGLFGTVHDGHNQFHDWPSTWTDADGRFAVRGLREGLRGTLVVRGEGRASLVYHLPLAENAIMQAGTITMPNPRIVRGRVVGNDGKSLRRMKVGLWGTNGDREVMAKLGKARRGSGWDLLDMYVALRTIHTDQHGAFAFGDVPPGTYKLVLYSDNNTRLQTLPGLVVTADHDPDPVEIVR